MMSLPYLTAIISAYVLCSVAGLAMIKAAPGYFTMTFVTGALAYAAGFAIWLFVIIRALPLSVAFPISAGALIIGTQIGGAVFLKETMSFAHIVGSVVVMIGIGIIYLSMEAK